MANTNKNNICQDKTKSSVKSRFIVENSCSVIYISLIVSLDSFSKDFKNASSTKSFTNYEGNYMWSYNSFSWSIYH